MSFDRNTCVASSNIVINRNCGYSQKARLKVEVPVKIYIRLTFFSTAILVCVDAY